MTPVGYMYKVVAQRPHWLKAESVEDIYSLSGCISEYFIDYIKYWKHNGYWLFDSSEKMKDIAAEGNMDISGMTLFYYEVFEKEYNLETEQWVEFRPEMSFPTNVIKATNVRMRGFDVVNFTAHTSPEHSPLSCNSLAEKIAVNRHCLLDSCEEAKRLIEEGAFDNAEPGPYRIFAIYTVEC